MSSIQAQTLTTPGSRSWLRMRAIARRHAYVLVRSPHRLFDVTLWPLVDVVLFGSLAAFVGTNGASGASKASGYLLAGIVLWHVIYQSQIAMSTGFLEETWTRNLLNIMVTPVREVEYVAGVALLVVLLVDRLRNVVPRDAPRNLGGDKGTTEHQSRRTSTPRG